MTSTFDLLTIKLGQGSPVAWDSLLPIFRLLFPPILDLGSSTGQADRRTDRQTDDGHQSVMPPPYGGGAGHINKLCGLWCGHHNILRPLQVVT